MERLMVEKSDQLLFQFFKALGKQERKHIGLMGGFLQTAEGKALLDYIAIIKARLGTG